MSGKEESRFYVELFLNPGNNCKEICEGFKSALFASTSSWGILESRPTNCVERVLNTSLSTPTNQTIFRTLTFSLGVHQVTSSHLNWLTINLSTRVCGEGIDKRHSSILSFPWSVLHKSNIKSEKSTTHAGLQFDLFNIIDGHEKKNSKSFHKETVPPSQAY